MPWITGEDPQQQKSYYITECTWMRKHGWGTPEWKVNKALKPDFHFKPEDVIINLDENFFLQIPSLKTK